MIYSSVNDRKNLINTHFELDASQAAPLIFQNFNVKIFLQHLKAVL